MKRVLSFILVVSILIWTPAQASTGRSPEQMMALFDEYLARVSATQQGPAYLEAGRQRYLSKTVIAQLAALEPEDFNVFMFYIIDRYVKTPNERDYINNFLSTVTETLAPDLEYSRRLQAGPEALMLEGTYKWGAWIFIAGQITWRLVLARGGRLSEMVRQMRQKEVALSNIHRGYGLGYRVATSPTLRIGAASIVGGAALGWVEHTLRNAGTHRLNPIPLLMVTQAQLACHLSYKGLGVQEEFEKLRLDFEQLGKARESLLAQINEIQNESKTLAKQWSRLENLDVRDRLFQQILAQYPKAESWQQFRSSLTDAETSQDGKCRQMSMIHLNQELEKTAEFINVLAPAPDKPATETPEKEPLP